MAAKTNLAHMPVTKQPTPTPEPPPKPKTMRAALTESRRIVAEHLPEVARTLSEKAAAGDVNHLKLFLEVTGVLKGGLLIAAKPKREPSLVEALFEDWDRHKLAAAAETNATSQTEKQEEPLGP